MEARITKTRGAGLYKSGRIINDGQWLHISAQDLFGLGGGIGSYMEKDYLHLSGHEKAIHG